MKLILSLLICCFVLSSSAQSSTIDSLQLLLTRTKHPSTQALLYYQLAEEILDDNPSKAIEYCNQAQWLLGEQDIELKASIYMIRGLAIINIKQLEEALAQIDSALLLLSGVSNQKLVNRINHNKSKVYYHMANDILYKNPQKAIEYINLSLKLISTDGYMFMSRTYNLKASAYGVQLDYDNALIAFDSALGCLQRCDDYHMKYEDIANIYSNQAVICNINEQYQQATRLLYKAIEIYDTTGSLRSKALTLNTLASVYHYLDDSKKTFKYIHQAIAILHSLNDTLTMDLCNSYYNLATMQINEELWDTAIVTLNKIIPFLERNRYWEDLALSYTRKSFAYQALGQLNQAIHTNNQALALEQSLYSSSGITDLYLTQAALYRETGQLGTSKQLYQDIIDSTEHTVILDQALAGLTETALLLQDFKLAYYTNKEVL